MHTTAVKPAAGQRWQHGIVRSGGENVRGEHIRTKFSLRLHKLRSGRRLAARWLLSQMLEKNHPAIPFVRIGTETTRAFGIADRDTVIIRSPVGHLTVQALADPGVGRGMVIMPVGTWIKRGSGTNVLTEDVISNFGEMAAYSETRVTFERVGTAEAAPVADASAALAS